ncbi:MAG: serine/threonine protein kinase [Piscinibacter sp.]|uniref:serine/threonine-protein kinase n=1 Tax=Piscinibacter sp. TaxID=1903157 RepID=UPI002586C19D|nr:serine/threonine-protein kinase [Piscinibacter sp.]MCW5664981.1 serine/threonine protein kinase [Piscinibacter sp.]
MAEAFDLTPAHWARLRELLDEALAQPADARSRWLDGLPPEDRAFAPRLAGLLEHARSGAGVAALLATLPKVETGQFAAPPPLPERVGPYRLVRELGSGGMASVWLAEREDMLQRRPVALKLPHGAWRRAGLAERLAREREILASLSHPNIARLHDAGVAADGQPWLALELVEGERIDAYCERHALDVPARLRLFLQAARAVAHAHAQLVVHRDLKPANILVSQAGEVKLLDFGIAKLLDQGLTVETELTRQAGPALTPEYAAPEQLAGAPVGTAADVYALGVVLYELLVGQRPYTLRRGERAALGEAVARAEVAAPSVRAPAPRRRALRGDLDTIVLKALQRDAARRYATAAAFAEDIARHLEHRPVLAQPDAFGYRFARFVRRHRVMVGAGAAVTLALLAGTGLAWWQAQAALRARDQAAAEAQAARKAVRAAEGTHVLAEYLLVDMSASLSSGELARRLDRAAAAMRVQYAGDAQVRATLLAVVANRQRQLGALQRFRTTARDALADARAAGDVALAAHVACWLALDGVLSGQVADAGPQFAAELRALDGLSPDPADPSGPAQARRSCLLDQADTRALAGDVAGALAVVERVQSDESASGLDLIEMRADTLMRRAQLLVRAGRTLQAMALAEQAQALLEAGQRRETPTGDGVRRVLASIRDAGGQPLRALQAAAPPRPLHLLRAGRAEEALAGLLAQHREATEVGDDERIQRSLLGVVRALQALDRPAEARTWLSRAHDAHAALVRAVPYAQLELLILSGSQALRDGAPGQARHAADGAEALLRRHAGPGDPAWHALHRLRARLLAGDAGAARRELQAALAVSRARALDPGASADIGDDLLALAECELAVGSPAAARDLARDALTHLQATVSSVHPALARARRLAGAA